MKLLFICVFLIASVHASWPEMWRPQEPTSVFDQYVQARRAFFNEVYTLIDTRLRAFNSSAIVFGSSVLGPLRYGDWHGIFGHAEADFADQDLDLFTLLQPSMDPHVVTRALTQHLKTLGFTLKVRPRPRLRPWRLRFRVMMTIEDADMVVPVGETFLECKKGHANYVTRVDFFIFGHVNHQTREVSETTTPSGKMFGQTLSTRAAYDAVYPLIRLKAHDIDVYTVQKYNDMMLNENKVHGYPACYAFPLVAVNKSKWRRIRELKRGTGRNCQITNGDPVKWKPTNTKLVVSQQRSFMSASKRLHDAGYPNVFTVGQQRDVCDGVYK